MPLPVPNSTDLLNYSSWIIGAAGLVLAVRAELSQRKARREAQTVTWDDIRVAIDDVAQQIRRSKGPRWKPDAVVATSPRGGIVAELLVAKLNPAAARIVGYCYWQGDGPLRQLPPGYLLLETSKWKVFFPESSMPGEGADVLFVDDIVISGTVHTVVREFLQGRVGPKGRVTTAALFTSATAVQAQHDPDFYSRVRSEPVFHWPWGTTR